MWAAREPSRGLLDSDRDVAEEILEATPRSVLPTDGRSARHGRGDFQDEVSSTHDVVLTDKPRADVHLHSSLVRSEFVGLAIQVFNKREPYAFVANDNFECVPHTRSSTSFRT